MKMSTKENPEVYLDVNDLLSSKCSKSSLHDKEIERLNNCEVRQALKNVI